jgi:hypothetical protein
LTDRQAFEEWGKKQGLDLLTFKTGNYVSPLTSRLFEAWQAARKAALEEAKGLIKKLWKIVNERRGELVVKEVDGQLSAGESDELAVLTYLGEEVMRIVAPLPDIGGRKNDDQK